MTMKENCPYCLNGHCTNHSTYPEPDYESTVDSFFFDGFEEMDEEI
jgi:hypothetical protein